MVGRRGGAQTAPAPSPEVSTDGGEETSLEPKKASIAGAELQNNLPEDEDDVCRICRTPGDDESPLYYPCACSGSIKYVHQDCLLQWLNHSNARQCEVQCSSFLLSMMTRESFLCANRARIVINGCLQL